MYEKDPKAENLMLKISSHGKELFLAAPLFRGKHETVGVAGGNVMNFIVICCKVRVLFDFPEVHSFVDALLFAGIRAPRVKLLLVIKSEGIIMIHEQQIR